MVPTLRPIPADVPPSTGWSLHQDIGRLLSFLATFDPDLRVDRFDRRAYALAIAAGRERYRRGVDCS
jgi:hypothetical protein